MTRAERMAVRTSKLWVAGHPKLVAEWHPARNVDLFPYEVRAGSNRRIWWKCEEGPDHEWQATPSHRLGTIHQRCPFCAGRRVSVTNSLKNIAPALARELHPTKNGALSAAKVSSGVSTWLWWRCPAGPQHVYRARVSDRVRRDVGCPFCARKRLAREHSLAVVAPAIARRWDAKKNGSLAPSAVSARSSSYAWFRCASRARHSFRTKISRMVADDRCPYCEGWELAKDGSLAARRPDLAAEWHSKKNGSRTPSQVSYRWVDEAWWQCPNGRDHLYRASVWERVMRGRGCPYCSGKRLSITNSLSARFPELAREWHPKKNAALRPSAITATDHRVVWWRCAAGPDHEWEESIRHRTRTSTKCPFCRGHRLSVTNSLAGRFPELAREWHPTKNRSLRPGDVRWGDRRKVWWKCAAGPDHEWQATIAYRSAQGGKCSFCIGRRLSVTNSFGAKYPALARQWHPTRNGKLDPFHVHATAPTFVWWKCAAVLNHVWRTRLVQRTMAATGCPACATRQARRGRPRVDPRSR